MQALKSPTYRQYLAAHMTSILGTWAARLAMAWLAWELSGSPFWTAVVAFAPSVPPLLFTLIIGVWVDRFDPKRILTYASWGMMGNFAWLALVCAFGGASIGILIFHGLIQGMIFMINTPVRLAFGPSLVSEKDLPSAVSLNSVSFNVARLVGPIIGGVLLVSTGAAGAFAMAALLYLPLVWILPRTNPPDPWTPKPSKPFWPELKEGLHYIWTEPVILTSLAVIFICSTMGRGLFELLPYFSDGLYQTGELGLTFLTSLIGAAAIVSGLSIPVIASDKARLLPLSLMIATTLALTVLGLAWANSFWLTALLFLLLSACGTGTAVSCMSLIQLQAPKHRRTRVMSLWSLLSIAATSGGALISGSLIDALGVSSALSLQAGIALAGLAICANNYRRLGLLPLPIPR